MLRKALQVQAAVKPGVHRRWLTGTERATMRMQPELEATGLVQVIRAYSLNRNAGAALAVMKAFVAERPNSPWLINGALLASEALFQAGRYVESMDYLQWVQQRRDMLTHKRRMMQKKNPNLNVSLTTKPNASSTNANETELSLTLAPLSSRHLSLLTALMHEVLAEHLGKAKASAHKLLYRQALHPYVEQLLTQGGAQSPHKVQKLSTSALFTRAESQSSVYETAFSKVQRDPRLWHRLATGLRERAHYYFAAQVQDKLLPLLWSTSPPTPRGNAPKPGPIGPYQMWHAHQGGPAAHPTVGVQAVLGMSDAYHVADRPLMALEVVQRLAYPYAPWDPLVHRRLARNSPAYATHFGLLYVAVDWVQKMVRGKHERMVLFQKRLATAFLQARLRGILGRREAVYRRKVRDAPVHMQRLWRGKQGRVKADDRRVELKREVNSLVLQLAFRGHAARKELAHRRRVRGANFIQKTVRRLAARRVYAAKLLRKSELERLLPGIGRRLWLRRCLHAMRRWQSFCFANISAATHLAMLATSLTHRLGLGVGNAQAAKKWQQLQRAAAVVPSGSTQTDGTKPRSIILPMTTRFSIQFNCHLRSPEGCRGLAHALMAPACVLKELSVTYCAVGDAGATAIAQALATCRLRSLDLKGNCIGDEGCVALALSLNSTRGHSLRSLCLSVNDIGRDNNTQGAQALARALQGSCSLVTLKLDCNELRSPGITTLCTALKHNQTLERLDLFHNHPVRKDKSNYSHGKSFDTLISAVTSRAKRRSRLAEVTLSSHPALSRLVDTLPVLTMHSILDSTVVKLPATELEVMELEVMAVALKKETESKQSTSAENTETKQQVNEELRRMREAMGLLPTPVPEPSNTHGLAGSLLDVDVDADVVKSLRATEPSGSETTEKASKQRQYVTHTIHFVRLFCL